jgi:hypothetical protein
MSGTVDFLPDDLLYYIQQAKDWPECPAKDERGK